MNPLRETGSDAISRNKSTNRQCFYSGFILGIHLMQGGAEMGGLVV